MAGLLCEKSSLNFFQAGYLSVIYEVLVIICGSERMYEYVLLVPYHSPLFRNVNSSCRLLIKHSYAFAGVLTPTNCVHLTHPSIPS